MGTSASLGPLAFISQTLNNCGPASISEVLLCWGIERSQRQAQVVLRADGNTHGMSLFGVPSYARSVGLDTLMGVAGNEALLKALISNGFPVIVSQWVSLSDRYGHYRPIQAYDDRRGGFIASDPYLGPHDFMSYTEFDQTWQVTDKRFIVIYPPAKAQLLNAVLAAAGWDKTAAYRADLAKLQGELTASVQAASEPFGPGYGFHQAYGLLNVAADEFELAQPTLAQAELAKASAQGANSTAVQWVAQAARGTAQ